MENAIKELPGVEDAVLSFFTQKMTIKAPDGTDFDIFMGKAEKLLGENQKREVLFFSFAIILK